MNNLRQFKKKILLASLLIRLRRPSITQDINVMALYFQTVTSVEKSLKQSRAAAPEATRQLDHIKTTASCRFKNTDSLKRSIKSFRQNCAIIEGKHEPNFARSDLTISFSGSAWPVTSCRDKHRQLPFVPQSHIEIQPFPSTPPAPSELSLKYLGDLLKATQP